jgi:hypothetical protein
MAANSLPWCTPQDQVKLYASLSYDRACVSSLSSKTSVASKREGRRVVQVDAPGWLIASVVLEVAPSQSRK